MPSGIEDYKNGAYALGGGVVDPLPEDAPLLRKGLLRLLQDTAGLPSALAQLQWRLERDLLACPSMNHAHAAVQPARSARAVLLVHGEKAHSCYFSRDAFQKLTGDNKELLIIPGASHVDLYDRMDVIPFEKLKRFFEEYLR